MTLRLSMVIDGDATGAKKAAEETARAITNLGTVAVQTSGKADAAFQDLGQGIDRAGRQAAAAAGQIEVAQGAVGRAVTQSAAAAGGATQLSTQQLAGMQFQMQDMAVMLASGQNPFVMLMQQGSQIVQMFGPGVGVGAALRSVGAGIVTFLTNPLNLALLGFATLAGGASLAWGAITGGAEEAGSALERHEALIGRIRDAWPEAAEGAGDYARESVAAMRLQLEGDADDLASSLKAKLDAVFAEVGETRYASPRAAMGAYFDVGEFAPFEAAIDQLRESLRNGDADVKAFRRSVSEIAATEPENAALQDLARTLLGLTNEALADAAALDENAAAMRGLGAAAAGEMKRIEAFGDALRALQGIALPNLSDQEQALAGLKAAFDSAEGPVARAQAMRDYEAALGRAAAAEQRIDAERAAREDAAAAKRAAGAAESDRLRASREAEQERQAVQGVIAALSEEYELMLLSDRERAVQIELRRAGTAATDDELAAIRRQVEANYDLEDSLQRTAERQRELDQMGNFFGRGLIDLTRGAREGLDGMAAAAGRFGDALQEAMLQALVLGQGPLAGLFGGGGGNGLVGWLGSLFGGGGLSSAAAAAVAGGSGGFYAKGAAFANGVVSEPTLFAFGQGRLGVMGEAGPEAVMPLGRGPGGLSVGAAGRDGREHSLPLTRLASGKLGVRAFADGGIFGGLGPVSTPAASSAGGGLQVHIHEAPGTKAEVNQRPDGTLDVIIKLVDEKIRAYDRGLPARVDQITRDPRGR